MPILQNSLPVHGDLPMTSGGMILARRCAKSAKTERPNDLFGSMVHVRIVVCRALQPAWVPLSFVEGMCEGCIDFDNDYLAVNLVPLSARSHGCARLASSPLAVPRLGRRCELCVDWLCGSMVGRAVSHACSLISTRGIRKARAHAIYFNITMFSEARRT